jgi:dicarboxylate transporter 10
MAALTKKVSAPELNKSKDVKVTSIRYPFWFGGSASCFATFFTHPLDLGKLLLYYRKHWLTIAQSRYLQAIPPVMSKYSTAQVRLQTQATGAARLNMLQMFGHVAKTDGIMALYRGVRTTPTQLSESV